MVPTIRDGDWLFVDRFVPVRTGDIAVIDRNGSVVVHRVISRRLGLEMGDACYAATRFDSAGVVGRVVALTRGAETVDMTSAAARLRGRLRTVWGLGKVGLRKLKTAIVRDA